MATTGIEHTRGPWEAYRIAPGNIWVRAMSEACPAEIAAIESSTRISDEEAWSNALLIAATPALLVVAEGVLLALKYPRGSEEQIRCLEEVGQDARIALADSHQGVVFMKTWQDHARSLGIDPAACRVMPEAPFHAPGRWVLTLPGWSPTLDNKLVGKHPMVVHRRKVSDAVALMKARHCYGVPVAIYRRRVSLAITGRYSRFPDDTAPLKSFFDALTTARLIVDDSREWLDFAWPPTFRRGLKETVITIEDLPVAEEA